MQITQVATLTSPAIEIAAKPRQVGELSASADIHAVLRCRHRTTFLAKGEWNREFIRWGHKVETWVKYRNKSVMDNFFLHCYCDSDELRY